MIDRLICFNAFHYLYRVRRVANQIRFIHFFLLAAFSFLLPISIFSSSIISF